MICKLIFYCAVKKDYSNFSEMQFILNIIFEMLKRPRYSNTASLAFSLLPPKYVIDALKETHSFYKKMGENHLYFMKSVGSTLRYEEIG
jgi:hypothetical protein